MPSSSASSSCVSCCSLPANCGLFLPSVLLNFLGSTARTAECSSQRFLSRPAKSSTMRPCVPSGLVRFTSVRKWSLSMYARSSGVWLRHWSAELMRTCCRVDEPGAPGKSGPPGGAARGRRVGRPPGRRGDAAADAAASSASASAPPPAASSSAASRAASARRASARRSPAGAAAAAGRRRARARVVCAPCGASRGEIASYTRPTWARSARSARTRAGRGSRACARRGSASRRSAARAAATTVPEYHLSL